MSEQNSSLSIGWLDPYGKFYPCSGYEHISEARRLVQEYNYTEYDGMRVLSPDEVLLAHGWVHIGRSSDFFGRIPEWRISWNPRHRLIPEQKAFLAPYFDQPDVSALDRLSWEGEIL